MSFKRAACRKYINNFLPGTVSITRLKFPIWVRSKSDHSPQMAGPVTQNTCNCVPKHSLVGGSSVLPIYHHNIGITYTRCPISPHHGWVMKWLSWAFVGKYTMILLAASRPTEWDFPVVFSRRLPPAWPVCLHLKSWWLTHRPSCNRLSSRNNSRIRRSASSRNNRRGL